MSPAADAPPSAWSAPVYPLVIAAAYRAFGVGSRTATLALLALNAICFGVCVAALFFLGGRLFGSPVAGAGAAALASVHPLFLYYVTDLWDGMLSLALFLTLTAAAVHLGRARRERKMFSSRSAIAFGAGMALLLLTNASYALTLPVLFVMAFGTGVVKRPTRAAMLTVAALVVLAAPWTIRNAIAFRRFVPIRTGSGIQLWLGNAPISDGWLDERAYRFHPFVNPTERAQLLQLGEPEYNALAMRRFEEGFVAAPATYVVNCVRRAFYLALGNPAHALPLPFSPAWEWLGVDWATLVVNGGVLVLGLFGAVQLRRAGRARDPTLMLLACCAAPFVFTAVIDRYALPVRMLLVLWGGGAVGEPLLQWLPRSIRVRLA